MLLCQYCKIAATEFENMPYWEKLINNILPSLFSLVTVLASGYFLYRYALRQKKKEVFIELEKIKYNRKLDALEGCWKLLQYMTDTENGKSILRWKKTEDGKEYFINLELADEFINSLSSCFYESGLGIYIPPGIKNKLFSYRNIIYGFNLKMKESAEKIIKVGNEKMAKEMIAIFQEAVIEIKEETDSIEKVDLSIYNNRNNNSKTK